MDQPPTVAFTAFADLWPRATGNGDRHHPIRHWCGRNFDFFFHKTFMKPLHYVNLFKNFSTSWKVFDYFLPIHTLLNNKPSSTPSTKSFLILVPHFSS